MSLIKRYPLGSYFVLAYAIFWLIWIPLIPHLQNLATMEIALWVIPLALLGIYAPTFAALIVVAASEGRVGLRWLIAPLADWRLGLRWYLTAIFLPILLAAAAVLVDLAVSGRLTLLTTSGWLNSIPLFLVSIPLTLLAKLPLGPMAEELGWRGYALPRLQRRMNAFNASLLLGILWALWHLPAFWVPGAALPLEESVSISAILHYVVNVVGITLIFTWLYNSTRGSLLIDFLFHAAYNALPGLLFVSTGIIPNSFTLVIWIYAVLLLWRYGPANLAATKVTKEVIDT